MRHTVDTPPGLGPLEFARWRADLPGRSWRDVLAAAPTLQVDGRYAAIVAPRSAALLAVLDPPPGARALVVGDRWGQLALPLARRAAVVVLGEMPAALALVRDVGAQEGVTVAACAGRLDQAPLAAGAFDLVVIPAAYGDAPPPREVAGLRAAAALLADRGTLVVAGAPGDDGTAWPGDVLAAAGLAEVGRYACLPDHQAPEYLVAPALLAGFLSEWAPAGWRATAPTPSWLVFLRAAETA